MARTSAVFFDVDFTLIEPGPRFQASGYHASCARHGIAVDPSRFDAAVRGAAAVLDAAGQGYDDALYVKYTRRIIELMGGDSPHLDRVARELYDAWAEHEHFSLYDDVMETLRTLHDRGVRIGVISNSHRSLATFPSHFALDGLIDVAVSSPEHGYMKPHPHIFRAALELMQVPASRAAMVGDSLRHDVDGARRVGMHGILIARHGAPPHAANGVLVIRSLTELVEGPHAIA